MRWFSVVCGALLVAVIWPLYAQRHETDGAARPEQNMASSGTNLLENNSFSDGLRSWTHWQQARLDTCLVQTVVVTDAGATSNAVRIANPRAQLVGVQQLVPLTSGIVYRLSASVRSLGNNPSRVFGGRLAVYLPPQSERELIWMTENTAWWGKELRFTNLVTGTAVVYAHMGYGKMVSKGEFTHIAIETLVETPPSTAIRAQK